MAPSELLLTLAAQPIDNHTLKSEGTYGGVFVHSSVATRSARKSADEAQIPSPFAGSEKSAVARSLTLFVPRLGVQGRRSSIQPAAWFREGIRNSYTLESTSAAWATTASSSVAPGVSACWVSAGRKCTSITPDCISSPAPNSTQRGGLKLHGDSG